MKKIYIALFFLFSISQVYAQWTVYSSPVVTNLFRSVYFLNADTGYIVGEDAIPNPSPIFETTDGGITHYFAISGTQKALRAVHFIDADTGFVVGFSGKIIKSIDGGISWTTISSGTTLNLRSIDFPSHDVGYICGGSGTVLKTTNAGFTWTPMNVSTDTDLINIRFLNDNVGFVVASAVGFNKGTIYKTLDGGATWNAVYSDPLNGFLGLAIADANTIYAGGDSDVIVKSTDGGTTWSQVYAGFAGHRIRGAFATNANTVWMVCDIGDIFYTNDGGANWTNQTVNANGIYGIDFPTPDVGYAVGAGGEILKYSSCVITGISPISGETTVCEGDSFFYSVNTVAGADNYVWTVPAGSVIAGGNGTTNIIVLFGSSSGNISVSASSACDTVSASVAVTVNPAPPVPTITFINNVLTSSSADTYQWYLNDVIIFGATNQNYTPLQEGFYSVAITNANGCRATSAPFDVIGLGINEAGSNASSMEINPNPVTNSSIISIQGNSGAQFISIADEQGKIIREISVGGKTRFTLDKKDFSGGVYFISLLNDQHQLMAKKKLIIQ